MGDEADWWAGQTRKGPEMRSCPRPFKRGATLSDVYLEDRLLGSLRLNPTSLKPLWLRKRELKYHSEAVLHDTQGEGIWLRSVRITPICKVQ